VLGLLEAVDPLRAVANATRCPAWQALIAKAIARCVLPVPGGPKKPTFMCSWAQASCARWKISGFSAAGWAVKSKSSRVLWAGNAAWRMRLRDPDASRAKTSASSRASRNCS